MFLFHARRVRTRTDRPHSPTLPGLPPANVAQRPKRCHTKMNARERVCVHKNKKPFASDSSSVAAVPAAPACSPFSSCRGGEKDTTRNVCSVVQPDTLVYLSTRKVSLPLSLSWGGGGGSQANTFTPTARAEVTLLQKGGGGAAGRGEQNNLATLK